MGNLLSTYQSWKAKFNNPDALVSLWFKPILVFKRNSRVQTTKQHLTPPPPNKERRRRGVLLKTRVVAASSQNNYSKEIPLLKLSSTFWVSDIKAKKHHTKLKNLISCILCEREKNSQLADGRCKCKKYFTLTLHGTYFLESRCPFQL